MNVRVCDSPIHGLGVFANTHIDKDDWQYVYGELKNVAPSLQAYGIEWDEETTFMPFAPWFYCNHSNEPNCEVCFDPDDEHHYISALRDIEKDEELTIDYGHDPSTE